MARDRPWMLALTAVAGVMVIFIGLMIWSKPGIGLDVTLVVDAARRAFSDQPMYTDPTAAQFGPDHPHYYGPPALAALYAPLAWLSDELIVRLAVIAAFVCAGSALVILLRAAGPVPRAHVAALAIGGLTCYAIFGGAALGNPSMLILPLLATAFLGLERDRPWLVGLGIGTAAALRLYPAAMLVPLILARRWQAVGTSIAVIVAWVGIGVVFAGPQESFEYVAVAQAISSVPSPEAISTNGSLPAIAWRWGAPDVVVSLARWLSLASGGAFLVLSGVILRANSVSERMIGFGVAVSGTLLLLSTTWDHYYVSMLIIVVGVVLASRRASFGLMSIGLISAQAGGGLAMLWMPIAGLLVLFSRSRRSDDVP